MTFDGCATIAYWYPALLPADAIDPAPKPEWCSQPRVDCRGFDFMGDRQPVYDELQVDGDGRISFIVRSKAFKDGNARVVRSNDHDWRAGVVRSTAAELMFLTYVIAALIWLLLGISFTEVSWKSTAMIGAVVIAVAVIVVWRHLLRMRRRRFGVSEFRFDQVPFMPGSKLRGTVIVPTDFSGGITTVKLTCDVFSEDSVSWSSTHDLMSHELRHENGKTLIPVEFDLPGHLPETRPFWRGRVVWRLSVRHPTPERSYVARFDLPVFDSGPVEDTMHVRAAKCRLERDLSVFDSVFDAPDERSTP